jgi:hypothetical protein
VGVGGEGGSEGVGEWGAKLLLSIRDSSENKRSAVWGTEMDCVCRNGDSTPVKRGSTLHLGRERDIQTVADSRFRCRQILRQICPRPPSLPPSSVPPLLIHRTPREQVVDESRHREHVVK